MILQKHSISGGGHLTPSEARLLVLVSRPSLTAAQQRRAAELVPQIARWDVFLDTAYRKFVLPMVYTNLATLPAAPAPADIVETMRSLSMQITFETLRRLAAFTWFHTQCVAPSGARYAYFKGPVLGARFYPEPAARFFRDVDILVADEHRLEFLRSARDQGCKIYGQFSTEAEETLLTDDDALQDFLFIKQMPHIVTPQGMLVEMHAEIDYHTSLFETADSLRNSRPVMFRQHPVMALSDTEHFVFICYHHTRHMWSKLNWLSDLDAMCNSPGFDRDAALALGRKLRIESTVAASLELHELTSAGLHPSDLDRRTPGADLLQACLDNLGGDLELEAELRRKRRQRAFVLGFDWQETPVSFWRRILLRIRKVKVSYDVFRRVPGGPRLRHLRYGCALGLRLLTDGPRAVSMALARRG